jgi:DNA gyrase subunit A
MPLLPDLFLRDSHFGNIWGIWLSHLSVSEDGYGKRTDVDQYRLQSRGGKGVINMKATPKAAKVSINLVDETTELTVISQFGKIIRIDTKSIRSAGRSTLSVKLLDLKPQDKVAAAVVIPPEKRKPNPKRELFCGLERERIAREADFS